MLLLLTTNLDKECVDFKEEQKKDKRDGLNEKVSPKKAPVACESIKQIQKKAN